MTAYNDAGVSPDTPRNRGNYDAPHLTPATPLEDMRSVMLNRVSWGAVFSGVAVGLVTQIVLNLFGYGFGVATVDYGTAAGTATATGPALTTGALFWWAASGIIAACIGGYVAGRMSGDSRESTAGWHGLTAWAASTLVVAGLAVAGAGVAVSGSMGAAGIASPASAYPGYAQNYTPGAAAGTGTAVQGQNVVPAQNLRAPVNMAATTESALFCAIALVLGAIGAWFCGRGGAVEPTLTDERLRTRQPLH